ncbi:hypothetical protein Noda2021_11760 [Candidatus Dependentiae bacterium Noda2021]|nr:hypothetical protein Noda2021_11760 [Candidatus Dependentiae bacterium Noda2021]
MNRPQSIMYVLATIIAGMFSFQDTNARCGFKTDTDFEFALWGLYKPETFYGKNLSLLNNKNQQDQIFFSRHVFDVNINILYGQECYGIPVAEFMSTFRNKAIWGLPTSISPTTDARLKVLDSMIGDHKHFLPRLFMWIRELWLDFSINEALGLGFSNEHRFKIGAFPFELGRGISLGSAFGVGPDLLGFYSDSIIDQFAFGAKFGGDIVQSKLSYDIYGAVLNNNSATLSDTNAKVLGHLINYRDNPVRGFGKINYLVASRLNWTVFKNEKVGKLTVEPYCLYNNDPEQKLEYMASASSHLGTFGLAAEFNAPRFECGFDCAFNVGAQSVKGLDRNRPELENRDGYLVQVNSKVTDGNGNKIPYIPGSDAQKLINRCHQGAEFNGRQVGQTLENNVGYLPAPITMINDSCRFRDPYTNSYQGLMFVGDAGWWVYKKDLMLSLTAAYSSGDRDPNTEEMDGNFGGFVGLQELYSGKRVRSAFFFGSGKLQRPIAGKDGIVNPTAFPQGVVGFTNIALVGGGALYRPCSSQRRVSINPNILAYWQPAPGNRYDYVTKKELSSTARSFLGFETNLFAHVYLLENLKLFGVASIFFPGDHYTDIRGRPLNSDQKKALEQIDTSCVKKCDVPNIGTDKSVTLNMGLEFTF